MILCLPSMSSVLNTVEKAYKDLKERGIVTSVRGKGFFVVGLKERKLRILLVMNKLSAYKKLIYYSFISSLGDGAVVDLQIHHYNAVLLKKILDDNRGRYHYYVIMPHFYEGMDEVDIAAELNAIPKDELVILDKFMPEVSGSFACVYQDFENDIYNVLEIHEDLVSKYKTLCLIFPESENYPAEIVRGFRKYCSHYQRSYTVIENASQCVMAKGTLYIVVTESALVTVVKRTKEEGYVPGADIGIISFNETELKEILSGGIATISTDFELMGKTAARLILRKSKEKIKNPFALIRRPSL
jgi:hypothetical protein